MFEKKYNQKFLENSFPKVVNINLPGQIKVICTSCPTSSLNESKNPVKIYQVVIIIRYNIEFIIGLDIYRAKRILLARKRYGAVLLVFLV